MRLSSVLLVVVGAVAASAGWPIKHVVVLMEENRSFDHMMGWMNVPGADGLTKDMYQLYNVSDPSAGKIFVNANATDETVDDPCHAHSCTDEGIFGVHNPAANISGTPTMSGFVQNALAQKHSAANIVSMWPPERVPIISTLATEFAWFDRFFCSYPGPTYPNRQFVHSGTAHGETDDEVPHGGFPQRTIYRQFNETAGFGPGAWKMYYEGHGGLAWAIFLDDVRSSPGNLFQMDQFYEDAKNGELPTYSFIEPRISVNRSATGEKSFGLPNHQHPDASVREGERLMKNVYEALRASPTWNETLLIITYDEHGGFFDHVPPPQDGIPSPDGINTSGGFDYTRLGVRIPTLLISPWIEKGTLVHGPPEDVKPTATSEWDLTTIPATVARMFNLSDTPLTNRTAWAPSFDYLLNRTSPRTDCPMTLPVVPPPGRDDLPDDLALEEEVSRLAALPLGDHHTGVIFMLCDMLGDDAGEDCGQGIDTQGAFTEWQRDHWELWQAKHAATPDDLAME